MKAKELDCEECKKEIKNIHHLSFEILPRNITFDFKKKIKQTVKTVSNDCTLIHFQNKLQTNSFK